MTNTREMTSKSELEDLQTEMDSELNAELFFFPTKWGIDGWLGTDDVCFVGYKPSTGGFPSRHDRLLYGSLVIFGLEAAHITDVSKETGSAENKISPDERQRNLPYLRRELDLLDPELVVAMGAKAEEELDWADIDRDYDTVRINHYTWGSRYGNHEKFISEIKGVANRLREINN